MKFQKTKTSITKSCFYILIGIAIFGIFQTGMSQEIPALNLMKKPALIGEKASTTTYKVYLPLIISPITDMNYYLVNVNNMYALGEKRGQQYQRQFGAHDGVVILDFGMPYYYKDPYGYEHFGTQLFDMSAILTPAIIDAVQDYCDGFWNGLGNDNASYITIIVGTNSYGIHVTRKHGEAWAGMINDLNAWVISEGYSSQIGIAGGIDAEPDWGQPSETVAWADGYSSNSYYWMYNYGSATDCPTDYPPTHPYTQSGIVARSCYTQGWTQNHVYHMSWGSLRARPFPEIYNTQLVNAQQWYRIALYSFLKYGGKMVFDGSIGQYTACMQTGDPNCAGADNTGYVADRQLDIWLSSDPYNRVDEPLYWITEMMWYYGTP